MMNDFVTEVLVPRKTPAAKKMLKPLTIVLGVVFFAFGLLIPLFWIGLVIMVLIYYFLVPKMYVEYEYTYVNGSLDIDAIYSKSSRKKKASFDLSDMEVFAPWPSDKISEYTNRGAKIQDFTSGREENRDKFYGLVLSKNGAQTVYLLEPDDRMLKDIRMRAPSKTTLRVS